MANRTHSRSVRRVLSLAICLALASAGGCDDGPTAPGPRTLPLEGTWVGSLTDRSAGTAALDVVIAGSNDVGTGTFTLVFADASANLQGLVLARTRDTPIVELTLNVTTNARDCSGAPGLFYAARLTLSGNRLTGTYEPTIGCPLLQGGSLQLVRR